MQGYDTMLVMGAHTTSDQTPRGAAHQTRSSPTPNTNLYWSFQRGPGRTAGTVDTADVGILLAD